ISSVQDGASAIVGMQAVGNSLKFGAKSGDNINGSLVINNSGNVGINTTTPASSAKLEVNSTTKGFLPPRLTMIEMLSIPSPVEGLIVYNTEKHKLMYYDGAYWRFYDGTMYVGMYYQGGVVFYLDGNGGGLICAVTDQDGGSGIEWYFGYSTTGATGTAIGTGQANTTAIINVQGAGSYAATVCDNYTVGSYSDWFLPSKDELNKMYQNKATINASAIANGGSALLNNVYWSSSEFDYETARDQWFQTGSQGIDVKYA
ncbi:MAG: DUF1566 domain-containing protein, partial [Gammaproteobacteria bacterium]|nr:DUF1566 domain-containing protein [Gammaproteobacteria bacterium]